jgi:hypothetical protein
MTKGAMLIIYRTLEEVTKGESKEFQRIVFSSTQNICKRKIEELSSNSEETKC